MVKIISVAGLLTLLLFAMIFTTPVTRLGSGFLVGSGQYVITYYDLIKEAKTLNVKFPNEDDIEADVVFSDPTQSLAILKLKEFPKVKRLPLVLNANGLSPQNETVFALGYPWTNTMEDQHVLIEGSTVADTASILIPLRMALDPVHSGSPLFNTKHEVVGMVLLENHARAVFPVNASLNFAIPVMMLDKALKAGKIDSTIMPTKKQSREVFIAESKHNIVLIEAR